MTESEELDAVALDMRRLPVAEEAFLSWLEGADDVEAGPHSWTISGDFWARPILWTDDAPPEGCFCLYFEAGTTNVVEAYGT